MADEHIGPYRIVRRLGAGGMGEVFLAEDPRLGRSVAIKRASAAALQPADGAERLRREAWAAAQLNHPNVAAIHDVVDDRGIPHIVMEYVDGETLAALVGRGPVNPDQALAIARQVADALAHAHAHDVVHRDLKPANVMLTPGGTVKVLDFGLARERVDPAATREHRDAPSQLYGTPGYMAPEQLMGARGDARSDIYGFGALLFELLTGLPAAGARDHLGRVMTATSNHPPQPRAVNPSVPAPLNDLVAKALAFDPDDRFQTADALREGLDRAAAALSDAPTQPVAGKARPRSGEWRSWRVMLPAAAAVAVLALLAGWPGARRAEREGPAIVAVLPFEVPAAERDLEGLGAGLADMIVNGLAATRSLVTVPRPAASDRAAGVDAARDLGANHLVGGTLRRTATGVDLTVRVGRLGEKDEWERSYTGALEDVLTLGRRMLDDLVVQLGAEALPPQGPAASIEAFQQYAQGRGLLDRRDIPGNVDRAIELLSAAATREPRFALAHAALGEAYWEKYRQARERRSVDRAEQEILLALSLDANQPLVRYSLATILHGTGHRDRAEQELRTIVSAYPLDTAHRLLGIILVERGRVDEAMQQFGRAIDIRPGFWGNYATQGVAALRAGRYEQAEASFRRVTELQPDNADAHANLGTVYLLKEDRPRAIAQFRRSIELAPSVTAWSNLGNALTDEGKLDEAHDAFAHAVTLRPRDALLQRNLGDSLARLKRTRDARAAYQEGVRAARDSLEVNANSADAHGALAICLAKLGAFDEAIGHASKATALAPNAPDPYHRRAAVLALAGRKAEAIAALREAMSRGLSAAVVARDRDLESLRESAEFKQLVKPAA